MFSFFTEVKELLYPKHPRMKMGGYQLDDEPNLYVKHGCFTISIHYVKNPGSTTTSFYRLVYEFHHFLSKGLSSSKGSLPFFKCWQGNGFLGFQAQVVSRN